MNLCERLREINKDHSLNKDLTLKVVCKEKTFFTGTNELIGTFEGYTQALDNEPEIAQLDLKIPQYTSGIVGLLETEIKSIEVIE